MQTLSPEGRQPRRAGERRPSEHLPPPSGPALASGSGSAGPGRRPTRSVEAAARREPGNSQRCASNLSGRDQGEGPKETAPARRWHGAQKRIWPRGDSPLGRRRRQSRVASAPRHWTYHDRVHTRTAPGATVPPGLGRPPYTGVASRGLQVWLASLGSPSRGWPLPAGRRHRPLRPSPAPAKLQVHSLLPSPARIPEAAGADPARAQGAQGCSAQKLAAPKGPCGLGMEFEAAALRSEITSGLSSRLSLRSISRTR